ncbi:ERF family protein [Senimuribacter intestinalis]|uniref:ERF family protein n=1 Tax=Senimuribacter intestinalis TaxID=2941507 RepID=UPI002040ECC5|nr:ERF family protein [Senimuribacter intestinalis]
MLGNLLKIQEELKAPKGQYNSFGKYNYRSCEDILEAVKPLLQAHSCTLTLSDDIVQVGERYYVKATATIVTDNGESVAVTAFARESLDKKGMDDSQITGTASSYARKYALNGLFLIDDTKDADTNEHRTERTQRAAKTMTKTEPKDPNKITFREKVIILANERGIPLKELMKDYGITKDTTEERFAEILKDMEG